jgi:hypothetical protein
MSGAVNTSSVSKAGTSVIASGTVLPPSYAHSPSEQSFGVNVA